MIASSINPRAATFRTPAGEIIGTTWGGTWCWHPLNPSKYATLSQDGGDAHILRCRKCPGCLELDRRELADRLELTFKKEVRDIWVVMVPCTPGERCSIVGSISRILGSSSRWGWTRIGTSRIAIVAACQKPRLRASRVLRGRRVSFHRVSRTRRRRAWRLVTAGMLYSRDVYGANLNRWYIRGLRRLERAKRVGVWRGGVRRTHPEMGPGVAGARGGVGLHQPEAYRPPRLLSRARAGAGRFAGVHSTCEPIGEVLAGLPVLIAGARLANTRLSPAGGAGASNSLNCGGAKRVPLESRDTSTLLRGRYSTSAALDRAELDAWVARMTEKWRVRCDSS